MRHSCPVDFESRRRVKCLDSAALRQGSKDRYLKEIRNGSFADSEAAS